MKNIKDNVEFVLATEKDAEKLAEIYVSSYTKIHQEYNIPIESDIVDTKLHLNWLDEATYYYKIVVEDRIIGGLMLFGAEQDDEHIIIKNIFIDNTYQNKGIGSKSIQFIEDNLEEKIWIIQLETPVWAISNHYFYEKNGFEKVSRYMNNLYGFELFIYCKYLIEKNLASQTQKGERLLHIGYDYYHANDYDKSIDFFVAALEIFDEEKSELDVIFTLCDIGTSYLRKKDIRNAKKYYDNAQAVATKQDDKKVLTRLLNTIGIHNKHVGNYPLAIEYYVKSQDISHEIGFIPGEIMAFYNIGSIYFELKQFTKSLEYIEQAKNLLIKIKDDPEHTNIQAMVDNALTTIKKQLQS